MPCNIQNNSSMDDTDLNPLAQDLVGYMQKKAGFKKPPSAITYEDDMANSKNILGKTAYYTPQDSSITVYVTGRHPKDILRSIAHELIHHRQNERGEFDDIGEVGEGYAQSDQKLRGMEREAYTKGNMCFRDWEDGHKNAVLESIYKQQQILRRNKTMKIHKWKNNELNRLLMERWVPRKKINESYNDIVMAVMEYDSDLSHEEAYDIAINMDTLGLDMGTAVAIHKGEGEDMAHDWDANDQENRENEQEARWREEGEGMSEDPLQESKKNKAFRQKVRLMLETINFKKNKPNKRVKVRRRRK